MEVDGLVCYERCKLFMAWGKSVEECFWRASCT